MRKMTKKVTIAALALSLLVTGTGASVAMNTRNTSAKADYTPLTKVLGEKDITLREKWNDKSNVGEARQVTITGGTSATMTVKDNGTMRPELSSQYLALNEMGAGINLGNTMEATLSMEQRAKATEATQFETAWGAAITSQAYMDCVHSYGINTIRIPVSWSNMVNDTDGKYTINEKYLGRVEEIVNYALNDGMYVIINDHWDNQWWGQFGVCKEDSKGKQIADEARRAEAWKRYESYWTQISNRFKGYSDHLIFEGANEELGTRLNDPVYSNGYANTTDKKDEQMDGNLTVAELYSTVNKINQKFVDVVRSTGGNNAYRHLLIPGYNTNIDDTADKRFIMPTDTAANGTSKLFVSVHYYTPWGYCGDGADGMYTKSAQSQLPGFFKPLSRFKEAGYGIIIGECGVCNPGGVASSVTQWFNDTFTEAQKYAAVPCIWDTSVYFDRKNAKITYKDIAVFYNTINGTKGDTNVAATTGTQMGKKFTNGYFNYKVVKDTATYVTGSVAITGLTAKGKKQKSITMENTVTYKGRTYNVGSIKTKAFAGSKAKGIVLNKRVKSIPTKAFSKCTSLRTLTINAQLKKVSKKAFDGCKKSIKVKGNTSKVRKANVKLLKKSGYKKFK